VSDLTLNRFLASGTAAERGAFVPDPPTPSSGPDPLYLWFETDTGDTYAWDGSWNLVAPGSGGGGDVVGPASAVDDRIATFNGVTGKLLQDGGVTVAALEASAAAAAVTAILPIDLTADVTGDLPLSNLAPSVAASRLLGRGAASGAGDFESITLGTNLSMTGTTLNAAGGGGGSGDVVGPASAVDDRIATFDGTTGLLIQDGGQTIAQVIAAATASILPIDLAADVTGSLPVANVATLPAAGRPTSKCRLPGRSRRCDCSPTSRAASSSTCGATPTRTFRPWSATASRRARSRRSARRPRAKIRP
jgi:hypothetical protein